MSIVFVSQYPAAYNNTYVPAPSGFASGYEAYNAVNPGKSLTGVASENSAKTDVVFRFHIDLGSAKLIKRLYYENYHDSGASTAYGVKNFVFYGTNDSDAFADTSSSTTDWVEITPSQSYFDQHTDGDEADPKYITLTNDVEYRYYRIEGTSTWEASPWDYGIRRLELQTEEDIVAMPMLEIVAGCDAVIGTIPIFTSSSDSLTGEVSEGSLQNIQMTVRAWTLGWGDTVEEDLPALTASSTSLTGEIHAGDCDVPFFSINATLLNGGISQGVASLPFLTFSGRTINTGTVSESFPIITISAYAHGPLLHTLDESLPLLQIVATLVQQSTSFRCYVMNTENSAITEYDNFPFNSFCTFKGKHLAAGSNGITLLEGNKDNSTDIKAYLNVGNNDFDLPNIKKVTDAYLSMKGDGSYYLTVTSDDGTPHDYLLTATTGDRIKNLKTNVGKGKKGRYFELELSNIAGADFELYDMVLNVELLKRNI